MSIAQSYQVSTQYTAGQTLPANPNRIYFFVYAEAGDISLKFGGGTGELPIVQGNHYNPSVVPTSEIIISADGLGSYVLIESFSL